MIKLIRVYYYKTALYKTYVLYNIGNVVKLYKTVYRQRQNSQGGTCITYERALELANEANKIHVKSIHYKTQSLEFRFRLLVLPDYSLEPIQRAPYQLC